MKCVKATTILSAIKPATTVPTHSGVGTRNLLASLKALLFVTATSLFVGMQAEGSGQGNADRIINDNPAAHSSFNNAYADRTDAVRFALISPSASRLEQALSKLPQDKRADALLNDLHFFHNIIRPSNERGKEMSGILEVLRKTLDPKGLCQVFSEIVMDENTLLQRLANFGYVDEVAKILKYINQTESREDAEELLENLIINIRNRYGESLWDISAESRDLRAVLKGYVIRADSAVPAALMTRSASRLEQALSELSSDDRVNALLRDLPLFHSIIRPSKERVKEMSGILEVLRKTLDPKGLCQVFSTKVFSEIVMDENTLLQRLANFGYVDEVENILKHINQTESRENAEELLENLIINIRNSDGESLWDISARNSNLRALLKEYVNGADSAVWYALVYPSASMLEDALGELSPNEMVNALLNSLPFFHNIIRPSNERVEEMSDILKVLREMLPPEGLYQVFSVKIMRSDTLIRRLAKFGYIEEVNKILNCINGIENRERAEELLKDLIINIRNQDGENLWDMFARNGDLRALLEHYTNEAAAAQTCLLDAVKAGGEGAVEAIHQALEGKTPQERYAFILSQQDDRQRNAVAICFQNRLYAAARELLKGLSNEHVYTLLATQDASDELALHTLIRAGNSENAGAELLKELLARLSEDQKRNLAYMEGECGGMTALMCARTPEMIDIIFSMVPPDEWDAYMRVQTSSGHTALFFPSAYTRADGSPDTIRALLNYSNDVKTLLSQRTNDAKRTPLIACVQPKNARYGLQNCLECIDALLEKIEDPALLRKLIQEDKDNSGKSAWDYSTTYPDVKARLQHWLETADAREASLQNA